MASLSWLVDHPNRRMDRVYGAHIWRYICARHPLQRRRWHPHECAAVCAKRRGYVVLALDQTGHGYSKSAAFAYGFGGPEAFTHDDNSALYSMDRLHAIRQTLRPKGVLAVWSAWHDPSFTKKLKKAGFDVSYKTVRAHKGKAVNTQFI